MGAKNPVSRTEKNFPELPTGWALGVDSFSSPLLPRQGFVRWCENAANKAGLWQTRPGYLTALELSTTDGTSPFFQWWSAASSPLLLPQGFCLFTPTNGNPFAVIAVSGTVWTAPVNTDGSLGALAQLANVVFSPNAQQVVFCNTLQTQTVVDGVPETPCAARNILIMQDGGSRSCFWDGTTSGSSNPNKKIVVLPDGNTTYPADFNQTRIGQWMAWSGNRLFLSLGPQVFASDLGDPLHFTEELILDSTPVINFPSPVTGMTDRGTSGNVNSQAIIFTEDQTWALWSGVQQRIPDPTNGYPGWAGTPNFFTKIFAGTGCVAGKTIINHRGIIYWLSAGGLVSFDSINTVTSSQNLPAINYEEAYANFLASSNQQTACAGAFQSYLLFSLGGGPTTAGQTVNSGTQVLDRQPLPVTPQEVNSWQGVWTGISPVEWASGNMFGIPRCYALSFDQDGTLRVYQAFQGNRADNGQPIPWSVETPLHQMNGIFDVQNLLYGRAFLQNVLGNLKMQWLWKGTRGEWHEWFLDENAAPAPLTVSATPGSLLTPIPAFNPAVGATTPLPLTFQSQVRDIKSPNLRGDDGDGSSLVEANGELVDSKDRAFGITFQFLGRGALGAYRIACDEAVQSTEGDVRADDQNYHILPGEGQPEIIDVTPLPDYILANDTQNGAIVAFDNQPPQNFGIAEINAANGAAAGAPYQTPQPQPSGPKQPKPSTPDPTLVGFVNVWTGSGAPPQVLFGVNSKGVPLNYVAPFLQSSPPSPTVPAGNNFNSTLTAPVPLYYRNKPPFVTLPQNFAAIILPNGTALTVSLSSWAINAAVFLNNTIWPLKFVMVNGNVVVVQPGAISAPTAIEDTPGVPAASFSQYFSIDGGMSWVLVNGYSGLVLASGNKVRTIVQYTSTNVLESPSDETPFYLTLYPFSAQ